MTNINNWSELINLISQQSSEVFSKLLLRINQSLRTYQKSNDTFDYNIVKKNHQEIFNNFKLTYEQLLIEKDITDIFVEIPSLTTLENNIMFNMIGIGKWIKFHGGNASRIFFFDEEKTIISDKPLADFLNKIDDVKSKYEYFGCQPIIYYKFKTLPSNDIVEYLGKFNVISLEFGQKTDNINYPKTFDNKVLLDQTMILTLCSNLSYGFSESFYQTVKDNNKEIMMKNREDLETYINTKKIFVNEHVYEQTGYKINHMAGPHEKKRYDDLCSKITVVPDEKNPRFYYLKDVELLCASVAEREHAVIVTGNQKLGNKIDLYYREIPYKIFYGAQLTETKYP
jgi:hypothetical protein